MTFVNRTGLLLACAAWLGCAPEETFRGGTRLQLQWLAAEDGTKVFTGFFDPELGMQCRPSRMTDGVVRCVPARETGVSSLLGPGSAGERFADDQCTQRLWPSSGSSCTPLPRLVTLRTVDSCAGADEVYEVGDVVPAAESFMRVGSTCERDPGTFPSGEQRRLAVFDRSKLIEFSEEKVRLGPLEALLGRSRDGASVLLELRDGTTGNQCRPTSLQSLGEGVGPVACMPPMTSHVGPWGLYSSPTCSTPAVQAFTWPQCEGSSPATPKVLRLFQKDGSCGLSGAEFFELGARVETPHRQGTTCEPAAASPAVYEVGRKLDPAQFPAVDVAISGSTLQVRTWQVAGRTVVLPTLFWLGGKPCSPTTFADGTRRCLPHALRGGVFYADAACTRPAFRAVGLQCESPEYLVEFEEQACSSRATKVFRTGAKLTGAKLYFKQAPAGCVEYFESNVTAWEAGEELPATHFPIVTPLAP